MSNINNNEQENTKHKKMKPDDSAALPRIDKVESVASTKWLALETYHYTDQDGKQRLWDVATRTTKPKVDEGVVSTPGNTRSEADAVVIIPLLRHSKKENTTTTTTQNKAAALETLLVEQFRPPVRQMTMEFPAGLVDKDETVEQAALRELKEETGFVGERCSIVPDVSRAVCMSPGLATETVHVVLVEVDLDNPYNHGTPATDLDDGEHVTLHRIPLDDGLKALLDQCPAMPIMGLYLFALGFQLGAASKE